MKIISLNISHLKAILSLDKQVVVLLPKGMYHHQNQTMIKACLESNLSLGLFDEEQLVGYRLTYVPALGEENLGRRLDMEVAILPQIAQFYGILVHPNYREKGWAKALLVESLQLIFSQKLETVLVTVHPDNIPSLNLFLGMGFVIQKQTTFYGGLPRYILALERAKWELLAKKNTIQKIQIIDNQEITPPHFCHPNQ